MICGTCGEECYHSHVAYSDSGERMETCNNCGNVTITYIPDVYWPGHVHTNPNITDRMGHPIELTSRRHKAQVMRQQGISEAGDRFHGSVSGNYSYFVPPRGNNHGKKR